MDSTTESRDALGEDDFEVVDVPTTEPQEQSASNTINECGNPFCQLSHVSREEERTSERAIEPLLDAMKVTAKSMQTKGPIFHTSMTYSERSIIFKDFVAGIREDKRRIMNCSACKKFMRQFGDLCIVAEDGSLVPLAWPVNNENVPPYYKKPVENVLALFKGKTVGNEFIIRNVKGRLLGTPSTGGWNHMSIELSEVAVVGPNSSMESQDTATSFNMLDKILKDNTAETIARAYHILMHDQLPYATSHKATIKYLKETSAKLAENDVQDDVKRKNLVTKYAREAFPGCISSLRGGMVGYLLQCISEGQNFERLKRGWQDKANPLSYLRPTAAPSVGNIETAEKIFARLGYTPRDLERVYLTLDQVPGRAILWSPKALEEAISSAVSAITLVDETPKATKLFSSLLPNTSKTATSLLSYGKAPIQDTTFRRFALKILPTASSLAVLPTRDVQPYFFTMGQEGSKPIMTFHNEGSHTAAWYTWGAKAGAKHANMKEEWTAVTAIITFPHMWDEFQSAGDALDDAKAEGFKFKRYGINYLFVVEGAKDNHKGKRELCLFPTLMRGEFHGVRKTVEAFSDKGEMGEPERGKEHVAGFHIAKDKERQALLVGVKTDTGQVSRYRITMFD